MNPLQQMEITEKSARPGRPPENVRRSRMITATSNTSMAASPKVEKNSTKPPTTAAKPVAFSLEIPRNALERPTAVGMMRKRNGVQARHTPHRKRFLFMSSVWMPIQDTSVFS